MKNKISVPILLYIYSVVLLSTVVFSAEDKLNISSSTQKIVVDKHSKNNSMKKNSEAQNLIKNNSTWPDVFVPSEKIDADSVIAFPADI